MSSLSHTKVDKRGEGKFYRLKKNKWIVISHNTEVMGLQVYMGS